jgi:ABC-type sugar transport system substrate-binding protein
MAAGVSRTAATSGRRCLAVALLALLALLLATTPAAAVKQTKAYVPPEEERNFTVHYWTGVGRKGFVWPEQE